VVVNCAAIPVNLLESELFGHEKGAFTGAHSRKKGYFEIADGGVIFLDEIGDLPPELQPKLLRVLQFGTFSRLGGTAEFAVDVQVLSATSKDLYRGMEEGRFSKALFHRLAVEVVSVPPLRVRKQDVLLLANHFMKEYAAKMEKPLSSIDVSAQKLLKGHDYNENNVRELKNVMERAVLDAQGRRVTAQDIVFSEDLLFTGTDKPLVSSSDDTTEVELLHLNEGEIEKLLEETDDREKLPKSERLYYRVSDLMEKKLILFALRKGNWKVRPAARLLGIDPLNLRSKMRAMMEGFLEEAGGNVREVSRKYRIPPAFVRAKLDLNDTTEKTEK